MGRRANGEGTVRKRANGTWEARLTYVEVATGRQVRKSFYGKTRTEVAAKLKAARQRLDDGAPVVDSRQSVGAWLRRWRETSLAASSRAPATKTQYGDLSRKHLEPPPFGAITLDRLRPSDVEALILALRAAGYADSTVRSTFGVLRQAMDAAVTDGLLGRNVVALVKRPTVAKIDVICLTDEQVSVLLAGCESMRYHDALVLIAGTGLREGEALGLTWEHVDTARAEIHVRAQVSRVRGQGLVLTPVKTAHSRRTVPLDESLVAMLKAHRVAQAAQRLRVGELWVDHGLVFATELGGLVDPRNLLREIQTAAKRLKMAGVGVHTLRHSVGTRWLRTGSHPGTVADLLGHGSAAFTMDTYVHSAPSDHRAAIAAGGKALNAGHPVATSTDHQAQTAGLLTIGEAADRLGVSVGDVRRWVRSEQCPVVRDGRKIRIPTAWVAAELAKERRRNVEAKAQAQEGSR